MPVFFVGNKYGHRKIQRSSPVAECYPPKIEFPRTKRRLVEASFDGGNVSGDAGALLLRKVDDRINLMSSVARVLADKRRLNSCDHSLIELMRQRVYGLCLGYNDLNDHDALRHDVVLQTAIGRDKLLASSPTLCRFENSVGREECVAIHQVIIDKFIASFKSPPKDLVLDFDSTDNLVYGEQEGRAYSGHYGGYCFLPLYVYCGTQLLVSYLRPASRSGARHSWAILALLTKRFRRQWPNVRILFRADSGFAVGKTFYWCEQNNVDYIVATQSYPQMKKLAKKAYEIAESRYKKSGKKSFHYTSVYFQAKYSKGRTSWPAKRRLLVKAECDGLGPGARFVYTSLKGGSKHLYDHVYNARGDMENRIKEQKLSLFSDRVSCHEWWANQLRIMMSSLAYVLLDSLRRLGLRDSTSSKWQCGTIRARLLKVAAVVTRNSRRVRVFISTAFPHKDEFAAACGSLSSA